jgi:hypothetical protein
MHHGAACTIPEHEYSAEIYDIIYDQGYNHSPEAGGGDLGSPTPNSTLFYILIGYERDFVATNWIVI